MKSDPDSNRKKLPVSAKPSPNLSGDTRIVNVNVVEGARKRVQADEGVVAVAQSRPEIGGFTVRKDLQW